MVKDNQFKPTFKQPFIPKTETRIFLGGRPIDQQTEQISSRAINKQQHYQSARANEINPGYGPCRNSLCGCSCSSNNCTCWGDEISAYSSKDGFSVENYSITNNKGNLKGGSQYSHSTVRFKDDNVDIKLLSGTAGANAGIKGVGFKASADLINVKHDGIQGRVGYSVDSGVEIAPDKVEVKVLGTGFSVNENQIGISTPFFEIKFDR